MSWSQPFFEAAARLIGQRTGLAFVQREASVEQAVLRSMNKAGIADPSHYLDRLAKDPRLLDDLVSDLTVGETYFFREPEQFQRIGREVIPDIRRQRGPEHVIRAWSAGCASGEEAYTLAIVFQQLGLGEQSHVLATDISPKALHTARRGICSNWSLRGECGTDALPYLERLGSGYKVIDAIRQHVTFASLNLALDAYPSFLNGTWGMDLILCRNVLIYFDRDTVAKVAQRLFDSLSEGGWLLTASADPPLWECAPFEVVATHQGIAYRRPAAFTRSVNDHEPAAQARINHDEPAAQARISDDDQPLLALRARDDDQPLLALRARDDDQPLLALRARDDDDALQGVRALANLQPNKALAAIERLLTKTPFSTELNYLHAMLLLDLGREDEAIRGMRKVLYLDRSLAVAHFTLASMLRRRGDAGGARRGFRNARTLCASVADDAPLPLGEGERAGRLAELAGAELLALEDEP